LQVTHLGQAYLKGSEGEVLSLANLIVYSDRHYDIPALKFSVQPNLDYETIVTSLISEDFYNRWMNIRFEIFGDTEEGYVKAYVDDVIYLDEKVPTLFHTTDHFDFHIGAYRSGLSKTTEPVTPIVVYNDSVSKVIY